MHMALLFETFATTKFSQGSPLENDSKRNLLEEVAVGSVVLVDILDYCSGGGGGGLLLGEGDDHAADQESLK